MAINRIYISEFEAVSDSASLLAQVLEKKVVVIEEDGRTIAVVSPMEFKLGRSLIETLAPRLTTRD
jgi:hypothetical protein